jgi:hypothetical protein
LPLCKRFDIAVCPLSVLITRPNLSPKKEKYMCVYLLAYALINPCLFISDITIAFILFFAYVCFSNYFQAVENTGFIWIKPLDDLDLRTPSAEDFLDDESNATSNYEMFEY